MVAVRAAGMSTVFAFSIGYYAADAASLESTCELNPYHPNCESNQTEGNVLVQRGATKFGPLVSPPAPPPGSCTCKTPAVGQCHCQNPPLSFSAWCPPGLLCVAGCCQSASVESAIAASTDAAGISDSPPNPFYKPTGIAVADDMLGFNLPSDSECGGILQQMMGSLQSSVGSAFGGSSDPTAAVQQLMANLLAGGGNNGDFSKTFGCIKSALVYADKHYIPDECVTSSGALDPSCCVHEKRCSTSNPADGCPWSTFGVNAPSVTCIGSHAASPVPMGICKCKQPGARCGFRGEGCLAPNTNNP
eukprot:TRINITY_DN106040_c0_g1_i1.p1 TRINITY_DN106040_c0_g1~~TRINITY_DN106040_c0_g1_i1.p1  ORF type:complete len:304 (+),score=44.28 TRINITY_DN106040_c0_g1_i1:56-967(+)